MGQFSFSFAEFCAAGSFAGILYICWQLRKINESIVSQTKAFKSIQLPVQQPSIQHGQVSVTQSKSNAQVGPTKIVPGNIKILAQKTNSSGPKTPGLGPKSIIVPSKPAKGTVEVKGPEKKGLAADIAAEIARVRKMLLEEWQNIKLYGPRLPQKGKFDDDEGEVADGFVAGKEAPTTNAERRLAYEWVDELRARYKQEMAMHQIPEAKDHYEATIIDVDRFLFDFEKEVLGMYGDDE